MKKRISGILNKIIDNSTAKVTVTRLVRHPKYEKKYRISKNYLVNLDDKKELEVGQKVIIEETRPTSKHKNWRLV